MEGYYFICCTGTDLYNYALNNHENFLYEGQPFVSFSIKRRIQSVEETVCVQEHNCYLCFRPLFVTTTVSGGKLYKEQITGWLFCSTAGCAQWVQK